MNRNKRPFKKCQKHIKPTKTQEPEVATAGHWCAACQKYVGFGDISHKKSRILFKKSHKYIKPTEIPSLPTKTQEPEILVAPEGSEECVASKDSSRQKCSSMVSAEIILGMYFMGPIICFFDGR